MTASGVLETIKKLGAAGAFRCEGDVLLAMGGRCINTENVNDAIASATACVEAPGGWRVTSVDVFGDHIEITVQIEPEPRALSIGPSP